MERTNHSVPKSVKIPAGNVLEHNIFIVWKPKYNLGIQIIDEHHRGIVAIINSLYYGMQNDYVDSILIPIIGMLDNYIHIHFQTEEDFLKKVNFPDVEGHNALHKKLVANLAKIRQESSLHKDPHKLMDFLKEWWINHICEEDMLFRNYLFK